MKPFIISDIDGTLVPHPYISGLSVEKRKKYVKRLHSLMHFPHFGLMTGRRLEAVQRLFTEQDLPFSFPAFLGTEFGTHLYAQGKDILKRQPCEKIQKLHENIMKNIESSSELIKDHKGLAQLNTGILESFFVEKKTWCMQIDCGFKKEALQKEFWKQVGMALNPYIIQEKPLAQIFQNRVDLFSHEFVPKTGFSNFLKEHFLLDENTKIIALGDEAYDALMFEDLKKNFKQVECFAVGENLPFADAVFSSCEDSLGYLEHLFEEI